MPSCWPSPRSDLLGRRSEAAFLAEVARDWAHLFPRLPHQSEANRRTRWPWGAFEQLRAVLADRLPEDGCQQVDTSALPVKHPSRVRGPDQWTGPGNDLAAVSEREVAAALLEAGPPPRDLLADKGFSGKAFAAQAGRGTAVLVPPGKKERSARSPTRWSWPGTALAPSGDSSPGPRPPSPPTPCASSASPNPNSTHIRRLRSRDEDRPSHDPSGLEVLERLGPVVERVGRRLHSDLAAGGQITDLPLASSGAE
jgi:hypothetical protein